MSTALQTMFTKIQVQGWNSINKPGMEDICHFIDKTFYLNSPMLFIIIHDGINKVTVTPKISIIDSKN